MKVLIIDDEVIIREGMVNVLPWEEHNYQVLSPASSGEEALSRIEKEMPDIIISDIEMPGMSGLELINHLASYAYPKEVIVLSGHDEFDYVQEAIKHNVSDYLLKTSSPDEILHSVNKARERLEETQDYMEMKESKVERKINNTIKQLLYKPLSQRQLNNVVTQLPELSGSTLQLLLINKVVDSQSYYVNKDLWQTYLYGKWLIHNGKTLIIIPRNANLSDDYLLKMATKKINEIYNEPIQKSRVITNLNELSLAYDQVKSLSLYKWLLPREYLISMKMITNREGISDLNEFKRIEGELLECIRHGDEVSLKILVKKFVSWAFTHPMATPHSIERYIQNLYFIVVRYINQISNQNKTYEEIQITEEYYSNPEETLTTLFTSLLIHIKNTEKGAKRYVVDAIEYITEHLSESITLQEVASHVHVHPNYLSEMIRKKTNKSYLELLTDKRMERAEYYIINTAYQIGNIAGLVGYSDRKHFTKIYKRYFNMTPSQYRKWKDK